MKVRMYNVGFGDCFCLRDRKKSLLVDFGTNNSRIEGRPRREIFDVIISDLSTINRKNLLLTHFIWTSVGTSLYDEKQRQFSGFWENLSAGCVFKRRNDAGHLYCCFWRIC